MAIIPDIDIGHLGRPMPELDLVELSDPGVLVDAGLVLPRPPSRLRVVGVEFIQSTQYTGMDGARWGAPGAVPLVALKTTLVRAFCAVDERLVRAGAVAAPADGERVTATLAVRRNGGEIFRTDPTNPAGVPLGYPWELDRELFDTEEVLWAPVGDAPTGRLVQVRSIPPLEFVLPGRHCRAGTVNLVLDLDPGAPGGPTTWLGKASFADVQVPRVNVVVYAWTDRAGTVTPAPTPAEVAGTVALAERMHPVPYLDYEILGTRPTTGGRSWQDTLTELSLTQLFTGLYGLGTFAFGLLPAPVFAATRAAGPAHRGCGRHQGSGGVGACVAGDGTGFAHELGHMFARTHVAVPGDATNDPGYPKYRPGRANSIGEVGIDVATRTVFRPADTADIMGYGGRQWISPYTYTAILDAIPGNPHVPADPGHVRGFVVLGARLHRDGTVDVTRAIPVEAPGGVPRPAGPSPLSVDVLDAAGGILSTHHFRIAPGHGCGCGAVPAGREPWIDVVDAVEWDERAAGLAFHTGGEPLARLAVGEAPTVRVAEPRVRAGVVHTAWISTHPRQTPDVVALYSADDGATWQPVEFSAGTEGSIDLPVDSVPGGPRCRLRLIASAELASADVTSAPFEVPVTPREVAIVAPEAAIAEVPVPLAGSAYSPDAGVCPPDELHWASDVDGDLGTGHQLAVPLSPGEHRITATAPDGTGGRSTATVCLTVR
jgi:hypothetical protein